MKFFKILKFDIKEGILRNYFLFICPVLIAVPAVLDTIYRTKRYLKIDGNAGAENSFGDVWMVLYGGMEKYVMSPDNPFNFPVIWSVVILMGSFIVLNYPMKDMLEVGTQYIVHSGSRKSWWASKVVWNLLACIIYHSIINMVAALGCLASGIKLRFGVNTGLIEYLYEFKQPVDLRFVDRIPLSAVFLPVVVAMTLNIVQMTLCLFVNPVYSYLINMVAAVSAAFIMNKLFVYNYAMPLRYNWIFVGGIKHNDGFAVMSAIFLLAVLIGVVRFKRYDIIRKEDM